LTHASRPADNAKQTAPTGYHAAMNLSVLPTNPDGTPDYSTVIAMVHSHPPFLPSPETGALEPYFSESFPDRLLYPSQSHTRDGVVQGDWITYDMYAGRIAADGGNISSFQQYIIGWDGSKFVIMQYDAADRETGTSTSGQNVDPNTEACTC
jgi:hypothetical protein